MAPMRKDCPLTFHDPGYHGPIDPDALRLTYGFGVAGTQPRFRDRLVAEPQINLNDYRFRAVFDWIEIGIGVSKALMSIHLHGKLRTLNKAHNAFHNCHVTGPDRKRYHRGAYFFIKIHDPRPEGLVSLLREFQKMYSGGGDLGDIALVGFELSLDVYPVFQPGMSPEGYVIRRMQMTELLRKHIQLNEAFRDGRRQPRFTYQNGPHSKTDMMIDPDWVKKHHRRAFRDSGLALKDFAARFARCHRQAFIDSTFYFGKRHERVHFRAMDKITDNRRGDVADSLGLKEQRSRLEYTFVDEVAGDWKGPATMGLRTFDDLVARDVGTRGLAGMNLFLLFGLPTFSRDVERANEPDAEEWAIFCKSGVPGLAYALDVEDRLRADPRQKHAMARREVNSAGKCLRYSKFNRRVGRAIKRLETRWQAAW